MRSHHLNLTDERSKENGVRGARQFVRRTNHTPNQVCVNTYFHCPLGDGIKVRLETGEVGRVKEVVGEDQSG